MSKIWRINHKNSVAWWFPCGNIFKWNQICKTMACLSIVKRFLQSNPIQYIYFVYKYIPDVRASNSQQYFVHSFSLTRSPIHNSLFFVSFMHGKRSIIVYYQFKWLIVLLLFFVCVTNFLAFIWKIPIAWKRQLCRRDACMRAYNMWDIERL